MGMVAPLYYTADMARALPDDGKRYEVVHGELLVTPAPRAWHQELVGRLYVWLRTYVAESPSGHVLMSPADISWSDDTLVQPDLFVVAKEEMRTLDWTKMQTLLLAIEVLSPSTSRADRFTKRRLYQEVGIPMYWIIDGEEEAVEVWTPDDQFPRFERHVLRWQIDPGGDPLVIDLAELFAPIR